ncbi:hypothetical protein LZ30DRAFT_474138 [Colletotrichum cereale]|nr:hypothetical protein LZ30DRAFT_474138 [Colletotrichum cereale]
MGSIPTARLPVQLRTPPSTPSDSSPADQSAALSRTGSERVRGEALFCACTGGASPAPTSQAIPLPPPILHRLHDPNWRLRLYHRMRRGVGSREANQPSVAIHLEIYKSRLLEGARSQGWTRDGLCMCSRASTPRRQINLPGSLSPRLMRLEPVCNGTQRPHTVTNE